MGYLIHPEDLDLLETVKVFCENEVKEPCKAYDISGEWPEEIYQKAIEMGLQSLGIPEEYGGLGLSRLTVAALTEQMAMADAGFATTFAANNLALKAVLIGGSEEQKAWCCDQLLDGGFAAFCLTEPMAGSDASAGRTTAVRDGDAYVLNGRKCFITNGAVASFYVVTAMTEQGKGHRGISAFLIDAETAGIFSEGHENKMGIRTSNTSDVVLMDCRVPVSARLGQEGEGYKIAMETLDEARAWVACMAVGLAQRAIDEAVAYGKQRIAFGQPILKNQALQFKIADMEIGVETARQMVAHTLQRMDMGLSYGKESAIAKCYAGDVAMKCATEAIQILGGYGYSRDYPVEKLLRDAKIFQIYEGTNEIQRVVISKQVIGKY